MIDCTITSSPTMSTQGVELARVDLDGALRILAPFADAPGAAASATTAAACGAAPLAPAGNQRVDRRRISTRRRRDDVGAGLAGRARRQLLDHQRQQIDRLQHEVDFGGPIGCCPERARSSKRLDLVRELLDRISAEHARRCP